MRVFLSSAAFLGASVGLQGCRVYIRVILGSYWGYKRVIFGSLEGLGFFLSQTSFRFGAAILPTVRIQA